MPGPDPTAVWIEEGWDGRLTATYEVFLVTNRAARKQRAIRILRNVQRGGWLCRWCNEPVPHFRRADARFCGESCRKKMARWRRHGGQDAERALSHAVGQAAAMSLSVW